MTIKDCIDIVDNIKPNQYTIKEKVMWLSFIDEIIINEVLKTHEGYDGRYDSFEGYSEDKLSVPLIVQSPYDRLYTAYLKMKIDGENGETARYNNSAALYNTYMLEFRKHYNKTHLPLDGSKTRVVNAPKRANIGLSDAEYENLKRDMTYILTEYFSNEVSADKLSDIITKFVQNNMEMLKGKDGITPAKGIDYFTETELETLRKQIIDQSNEEIKALKNTLESMKDKVDKLYAKSFVKTVTINLLASKWIKDGEGYSQVVYIDGITQYSKIDLQPSAEQLIIFHEKDIAFVTENENGVITVFCIGQKPTNDYSMQATITEVI